MTVLKSIFETYRSQGLLKLFQRGWMYFGWILEYYILRDRSIKIDTHETQVGFVIETFHEYVEARYFLRFERDLLYDLLNELRTDDVFYDVGANLGIYTVASTASLKYGTVVAFEPYPPNIVRLKQNIDRNDVQDRVIVQDVALSDQNGTINLIDKTDRTVRENNVSGTISIAANDVDAEGVTADTIQGDKICGTEVPPPNVVKIDVEGAEPLVVKGMENALRNSRCRLVYCEVHSTSVGNSIEQFGSTAEEFWKQLEDLGFHVSILRDRGEQGILLKAVADTTNDGP